jgi:hypothetical protein
MIELPFSGRGVMASSPAAPIRGGRAAPFLANPRFQTASNGESHRCFLEDHLNSTESPVVHSVAEPDFDQSPKIPARHQGS